MSTDSTELTFVRCPSCRSLVPAVSTRCRMCGATLDASNKLEETEEQKRAQSRVRQRTMSQPSSELTDTASQLRQGEAGAAESLDPMTDPETLGDDPLGAYIEELEVQDEFGADDDDDSPFGAVSRAEPAAAAKKPGGAAPRAEDTAGKAAPGADQPAANRGESRAPAEFGTNPRGEPAERSKVVVESGARPQGKPSSLSFGKSRDQQGQAKTAPDAGRGAERGARPERQESRPEPSRSEPRQEKRPEQRTEQRHERRDEKRDDSGVRNEQRGARAEIPRQEGGRGDAGRPESGRSESGRPEQRDQRGAEEQRAGRPEQRSDRVPANEPAIESRSGKLCGWLVSYKNPDGSGVELRDGKFFTTGGSLKKGDLVLQHPSISTPHAMVSVSAERGLMVQDLMSEAGVHVRRRGESSYVREENTVRLEHGDWVRFGDVEFLVCLISAPVSRQS